MPATATSTPQRLALTLDPGVVLERLILRQLAGLTRKRGQDWLRSLLVQGYLLEGQWLRNGLRASAGSDEAPPARVPSSPFAAWLERSDPPATRVVPQTAKRPASPKIAPVRTSTSKPFAHLRGVIGH